MTNICYLVAQPEILVFKRERESLNTDKLLPGICPVTLSAVLPTPFSFCVHKHNTASTLIQSEIT